MPKMHDPYKRMLVNACILFIVNNITAILLVNLFDHIDGGVSESYHIKGVYIYAMISAFVSSIYSNSMYMESYIKASRELSAAIEKVKKAEKASETSEGIRELIDAVQHGGYRYRERFLLPYRDGYNTVSVGDINHILYIGKYFGGKLMMHLKGYEDVDIVVSKERAALLKQWLDR